MDLPETFKHNHIKKATEFDPKNKSAWHYFAMLNYEASNYLESMHHLKKHIIQKREKPLMTG